MIISLRLKNFYSLKDDTVLDFTADGSSKDDSFNLSGNLIDFSGDKFVNLLGIFGSNAAGKSNIIKALEFCRNLILTSHLNNEGDTFDFEPFKFEKDLPSEFHINFVTGGIEYEYGFTIKGAIIISEYLYHYPNKRRARIFERDNTYEYRHRKGTIHRPTEIEANTGEKTLFLSRASSMNRPLAQTVLRFFLNEMIIATAAVNFTGLNREDVESNKEILLKAFEVSDSDIIDLRFVEKIPGQPILQSFHRENPTIPFDFEKEESEGTKRLLILLISLLRLAKSKATMFIDEFDLKLHLHLAELLLDAVRASNGGQLVFTSHTSSLINTSKLRREQIIFVTKQSNGNSEFVPLSDFEDLSHNIDIQKAYLQGRFDGIPYIGNIYPLLKEIMFKNETEKV